MNKLLQNHSFHAVFKIVAVFLIITSGLLLYFYAKNLHPYSLKQIKAVGYNNNLRMYHDFDHDGISELVQAFYDTTRKTARFIVKTYNGHAINDWGIPGKVLLQYRKPFQWFEMGDVNNDGYDDIIVFSQQNDSLFLYAIDVKNSENNVGNFLIERSFLLTSVSNRTTPWDVYFNNHAIVDLDNDAHNELIFTIVTGGRHHPRGIYRYDFNQQKIIARYETNASLMDLDFYDLNNDGKKEIIASTYAGGNFPPEAQESDFFSWIFVFDSKLRPAFQPIRLYGFTSAFKGAGFTKNNTNLVCGFVKGIGKSNQPSKLLLINDKGNIIKSKIFPKTFESETIFYRANNDSIIIVIINRLNNEVKIFDQNFHLLAQKNFDNAFFIKKIVDLNHDGKVEFIALQPYKLLVLNKNLNIIAETRINNGSCNAIVTIGQAGTGQPKNICVSAKNFYGIYSYIAIPIYSNPKFQQRFVLWFLLVLFLLIYYYKGGEMAIRWNAISQIQENNSDGLLIIDDEGRVMFYNTPFLNKTGIKSAMRLKQSYRLGLQSNESIMHLIDQAIQAKKKIDRALVIKGKTYHISVSPIHAWSGLVAGYWIQIIEQAPKFLDERTKIWANTIKKLAHDIKTPLSNIDVGVRTVRDSILASNIHHKETLAEDLDILRSEVKRITNVVSGFLKFVNLESPRFQKANINEIIKKSAQNFSAYWNSNFKLEFELSSDIPPFYFDPQQIELVFNNLIKNALDALRENGTIIIRTHLLEDEISEESQQFCEIEVTDNGKGIEGKDQLRIFEPEFSGKEGGSGMGLTIVQKIIKDHKGEIKVVSTYGIGTTFRILLPINKEDVPT